MNGKLRVGIVGANRGQSFLLGFRGHAEIAALCDLDPRCLEQTANQAGVSLRLGLSVDSAFRCWSASLALPDPSLLCPLLTSASLRAALPLAVLPLRPSVNGVVCGADLPPIRT